MKKIDSHDRFDTHRIEALGYDWSWTGNRNILPVGPRQVFFPTNLDQVVEFVVYTEGVFKIRGTGHSDNGLVLSDQLPIICTAMLNDIRNLRVGDDGETLVDVDAGTEIGELEDWLASPERPFMCGLKIRPDHDHISVGGFASVGGVSTASHLDGLFVDTVRQISLVTREGERQNLTRRDDAFYQVLCGAGEKGVMVTLTLEVLQINKKQRLLQTHVDQYLDENQFANAVRAVGARLPANAEHIRGIWVNSGEVRMGFLAKYKVCEDELEKNWHARHTLIHELESIGRIAGNAEVVQLENAVKLLGFTAIIDLMIEATRECNQKGIQRKQKIYLTDHDVETLTDRVLDSSVGSPSFMLAAFVHESSFVDAFLAMQGHCEAAKQAGDFYSYVIYSRPIRSKYLSRTKNKRNREDYLDLSLFMFLSPAEEAWVAGGEAFDAITEAFDQKCTEISNNTEHKMFRYMATRTEFRPGDLDPRDPNTQWQPEPD